MIPPISFNMEFTDLDLLVKDQPKARTSESSRAQLNVLLLLKWLDVICSCSPKITHHGVADAAIEFLRSTTIGMSTAELLNLISLQDPKCHAKEPNKAKISEFSKLLNNVKQQPTNKDAIFSCIPHLIQAGAADAANH